MGALLFKCLQATPTGLMIMASHQKFSSQIKHLFSQIKFGQTNLLYISMETYVIEFAKGNECLDDFQSLS